MITRVPRELGRPCRLHRHAGRRPGLPNSRTNHGSASRAVGDEPGTQRWYRQAKETKRGETDGRESERLIVSTKRGNRPSWTPWREGDAALWARRLDPCEGIEPHQHVTVRASSPVEGRYHDVTSRMREIRQSGSVGARGEQSPWATRPRTGKHHGIHPRKSKRSPSISVTAWELIDLRLDGRQGFENRLEGRGVAEDHDLLHLGVVGLELGEAIGRGDQAK